jgi:hypothetical protein
MVETTADRLLPRGVEEVHRARYRGPCRLPMQARRNLGLVTQ